MDYFNALIISQYIQGRPGQVDTGGRLIQTNYLDTV